MRALSSAIATVALTKCYNIQHFRQHFKELPIIFS